MTEDERAKLYELDEMVRELHRAFMAVPAGKKTALIEDMRIVSEAYNRGAWAARSLLWLLPTFAGLLMAWDKIVAFFWAGK